MIIIQGLSGRFGNQMIHYFNLLQLADLLNITKYSINWAGFDIFNIKNDDFENKPQIHINGKYILSIGINDFINKMDSIKNNNNLVLDVTLGDLFFKFNKLSTRDVFRFKSPILLNDNFTNVGIHFRGTDFNEWSDGNGILGVEYYKNAIDFLEQSEYNIRYYLFTDDPNMKSFNFVKNYLLGKDFFEGDINNYLDDFKKLSQCDIVISSPSTFSIAAGFVGKEKKIIHAKSWINYTTNNNDIFWVDLAKGGNKNYKIWQVF